MGNPSEYARLYYENGADEIFYQDVVASLYGRNSIADLVRRTSENTFIPLTVGGGIRSIDDIRCMLRSGADKVCINTAAVKRPAFIREAAKEFGSQCVVISIEYIANKGDRWTVMTDCGRNVSAMDAYDWAMRSIALGAGEIMMTAVDKAGKRKGMDTDLLKKVASRACVPVIAHGGAGSVEHISDAFHSGACGVALSTILHTKTIDIKDIKNGLACDGWNVRLI
jgi:cyclase